MNHPNVKQQIERMKENEKEILQKDTNQNISNVFQATDYYRTYYLRDEVIHLLHLKLSSFAV